MSFLHVIVKLYLFGIDLRVFRILPVIRQIIIFFQIRAEIRRKLFSARKVQMQTRIVGIRIIVDPDLRRELLIIEIIKPYFSA